MFSQLIVTQLPLSGVTHENRLKDVIWVSERNYILQLIHFVCSLGQAVSIHLINDLYFLDFL